MGSYDTNVVIVFAWANEPGADNRFVLGLEFYIVEIDIEILFGVLYVHDTFPEALVSLGRLQATFGICYELVISGTSQHAVCRSCFRDWRKKKVFFCFLGKVIARFCFTFSFLFLSLLSSPALERNFSNYLEDIIKARTTGIEIAEKAARILSLTKRVKRWSSSLFLLRTTRMLLVIAVIGGFCRSVLGIGNSWR